MRSIEYLSCDTDSICLYIQAHAKSARLVIFFFRKLVVYVNGLKEIKLVTFGHLFGNRLKFLTLRIEFAKKIVNFFQIFSIRKTQESRLEKVLIRS